jgi:cobalt-zinc-cadmium efflux system membrane fusion protein
MKKHVEAWMIAAAVAGALTGSCRRAPEPKADGPATEAEHAHGGEAEEHHEHGAGTVVRIAPDMLRDLRITTATVERRPGGEGAAVLGELGVNENAYVEIGPAIAARIVRFVVAPGQHVSRGTPLVELEAVELGRARAEVKQAQARNVLAQKAHERKRRLAEERIAPEREVQEAAAEAEAAAASLAAARAALEALGTSAEEGGPRLVLASPMAGTVFARQGAPGQMADPSRPLLKVADLATLWLTAHAPESEAVRIQSGSVARVNVPALPGAALEARVILVGSEVEPASRTIPVRLSLSNADGRLRPGMAATVYLRVGSGAPVLAVPAAALQRLSEHWCVFVPEHEGEFEVRRVGRGRDLGGEVEILSGLAENDRVVVEGAFLLKAEAEKASGEGGHHDH